VIQTGQVLATLALCLVVWGVISLIRIAIYLASRGEKINYVFIKLFALKYVQRYRVLTAGETGRPGFWFYSYVLSMLGALLFGTLTVIFA
jgi:hypothetical protein